MWIALHLTFLFPHKLIQGEEFEWFERLKAYNFDVLQFYNIISNFSCTPVTQLAKMFKPWRPWLVKRLWPLTTFCTWNFWPSLKRISLPREATKTELFLNLWILDGNCWGFSLRKCSKEFQQAFWPNIIPEIQSINNWLFFKNKLLCNIKLFVIVFFQIF